MRAGLKAGSVYLAGRTKGVTFDTLEKLAKALEVHAAVLIEQKGK